MILNIGPGIVLAPVGPPVDVPSAHSAVICKCTLMSYILCLHIDGHVRLYPYLAMCEGWESCDFNS